MSRTVRSAVAAMERGYLGFVVASLSMLLCSRDLTAPERAIVQRALSRVFSAARSARPAELGVARRELVALLGHSLPRARVHRFVRHEKRASR